MYTHLRRCKEITDSLIPPIPASIRRVGPERGGGGVMHFHKEPPKKNDKNWVYSPPRGGAFSASALTVLAYLVALAHPSILPALPCFPSFLSFVRCFFLSWLRDIKGLILIDKGGGRGKASHKPRSPRSWGFSTPLPLTLVSLAVNKPSKGFGRCSLVAVRAGKHGAKIVLGAGPERWPRPPAWGHVTEDRCVRILPR